MAKLKRFASESYRNLIFCAGIWLLATGSFALRAPSNLQSNATTVSTESSKLPDSNSLGAAISVMNTNEAERQSIRWQEFSLKVKDGYATNKQVNSNSELEIYSRGVGWNKAQRPRQKQDAEKFSMLKQQDGMTIISHELESRQIKDKEANLASQG